MKQNYLVVIWGILVLGALIVITMPVIGSWTEDMLAKISVDKTESKKLCPSIQDGEIYTTDDELIDTGYSEWGYNYQAHMFNGFWCDYHPIYRPGGSQHEWCLENYGNVQLMMKWNDAWLSNKDCDKDGKLDRHYGYANYIGSGAWLTNHESGTYQGDDEESCFYNYFVKIVAVPEGAYEEDSIWYMDSSKEVEVGPEIWGSFAIIQEVLNDPCVGMSGLQYRSPVGPGLGKF